MLKKKPSIALVYDHLATTYGGAEQVIKALSKAFPEAPIFTSVYNAKKAPFAKAYTIKSSFLQKIPFASHYHRLLAIAMPIAFETHDLDDYDIIISISSSYAKGVITKPTQLHICYLLTPTRYIFSHQKHYLASHPFLRLPGIAWLSKKCIAYLKWWDTAAAYRPDHIIAISNLVEKRTQQFYKRNVDAVIYPPVQPINNVKQSFIKEHYYIVLSRLVSYKRIDLAIEACLELDKPLIIVGEGPAKQDLLHIHPYTYVRNKDESIGSFLNSCFSLYKNPVCFVGHVDEEEKNKLLAHAEALLMPGEEDFGITALEAASLGIPTVLNFNSGVAEILLQLSLKTDETLESLVKSMERLNKTPISAQKLKKQSLQYQEDYFIETFTAYIKKKWQNR